MNYYDIKFQMPTSSGLSTLHQKLNTYFAGRNMGVLRQEVFLTLWKKNLLMYKFKKTYIMWS